MRFDAAKFSIHEEHTPMGMWGGGHTVATDPTKKGWRCRLLRGSKSGVRIVGRKGVEGCASFREMGDGTWDVAIYDRTPAVVSRLLQENSPEINGFLCSYSTVDDHGGFGLNIINLIKEEMDVRAQLHI